MTPVSARPSLRGFLRARAPWIVWLAVVATGLATSARGAPSTPPAAPPAAQTPSPSVAGAGGAAPPASTSSSPAAASSTSLAAAWQRELMVLLAERDALVKERDRLRAAREKDTAALRATAVNGETALLAETAAVRALEARLDADARAREVEGDTASQVQALVAQAKDALSRAGQPVPAVSSSPTPAELTALFAAGIAAAAERATVVVKDGSFYDARDILVEGRVLRVGGVAQAGVGVDGVGTALVPAGEGRVRAVTVEGAGATAVALAGGNVPDVVTLVLTQNGAPWAPRVKKSLAEYTAAGGGIAWVIVGLGLLALLTALVRGLWLLRLRASTGVLVHEVPALLSSHGLAAARRRLSTLRGPGARLLSRVVTSLSLPREAQEDRANEAFVEASAAVDRGSALLLLFAAVAPLLGLLGTVSGMIATFDLLTLHGNADPKLLSSGISEALITTEYGLWVAIPALLVGTLQKNLADDVKAAYERAVLRTSTAHAVATAAAADEGGPGAAGMTAAEIA